MPDIVDEAQNRIKMILDHGGINIKDIANETQIPYSTVREMLSRPGRLNIPWLIWYASFFGTTTDYLLSRDKPNKEIGSSLRLAREHAGISLKEAHELLGTSEYALEAIEKGEMEAPLSVLQKAVEEYRLPYEFIMGSADQAQDVTIITTLFRDIKFLLICQDIHKRPELQKTFSLLRGLPDKELGRLSKVIEYLVSEWIEAPAKQEATDDLK